MELSAVAPDELMAEMDISKHLQQPVKLTFETVQLEENQTYELLLCYKSDWLTSAYSFKYKCGYRTSVAVDSWSTPHCLATHKFGLRNIALNLELRMPRIGLPSAFRNCVCPVMLCCF